MKMSSINTLQAGSLLAALAVALGAFAAHGLKGRLDPQMLANFETAVRYHMYASLAMMILGKDSRAGVLLLTGTIIFSGSLYILSLTGIRWLGAITPIGGLFLIAGFVMAAVEASRR